MDDTGRCSQRRVNEIIDNEAANGIAYFIADPLRSNCVFIVMAEAELKGNEGIADLLAAC